VQCEFHFGIKLKSLLNSLNLFNPSTGHFFILKLLSPISYVAFDTVKGTLSRDFRPLFFSSNNSIWDPDTWVEILFAYGFVFTEIFDYEIDFFVVSGFNNTAGHKSDPSLTPIFFVWML
jgi:hypothetical protein